MAATALAACSAPATPCRQMQQRLQAGLAAGKVPAAGRGRCRTRQRLCIVPACARDAPLLLQAAVRLREPGRATASRQPSRVPPAAAEIPPPPAAAEVTLPEIVAARDAWAAAVSRRDLDAVCKMYDPSGSRLLGTLDVDATGIRASASCIRTYFQGFLLERHVSILPLFCDGGDGADVMRLAPGVAAYAGYYSFRLVPTAGTTCVAHAKFTFVYRRVADGRLLIALHNSGLTPVGIRSAEL